MSKNNLLNRLLGEAAPESVAPPADNPPGAPAAKPAQPAEPVEEKPPAPDQPASPQTRVPPANVNELAQLWQQGEHMGVATQLMFTEASYVDFVNLAFIIGQEAAIELGTLLDELADSEGINPPETPPEYNDLLRRAVGSGDSEKVL